VRGAPPTTAGPAVSGRVLTRRGVLPLLAAVRGVHQRVVDGAPRGLPLVALVLVHGQAGAAHRGNPRALRRGVHLALRGDRVLTGGFVAAVPGGEEEADPFQRAELEDGVEHVADRLETRGLTPRVADDA